MIRLDLPEREYHARAEVSFHKLKDFEEYGPRAFHDWHVSRELSRPEPGDWGTIGTAAHILGLEGREAFESRTIQQPDTYPSEEKKGVVVDKPWHNGAKFCKEWVAEQEAAGRLVLSGVERAIAIRCGANMRAHPVAAGLLRCGFPEASVIQSPEREGTPGLRARIDWIASDTRGMLEARAIVDVKTCEDMSDFARAALRLGYHRQAAWYRWIIQQEIGRALPVWLVAVEKTGANRCRVWEVAADLMDRAHEQNMRTLDLILDCYARGSWPLDLDGQARRLEVPDWMKKADEAAPW